MSAGPAGIRFAFLVPPILALRLAAAGESLPTACSPGEVVPLGESDRQAITLDVVQRHPLASSSPGIKFAAAWCSMQRTESADVIFYPHAESAGIKQAFQVHCERGEAGDSWSCDRARLRRYLQLDSQEFEVRVAVHLGTDEVLALIQATRATAQATAAGAAAAQAAIIVIQDSDGYVVGWGSDEGYQDVLVRAQLRLDGDPAVPDDWLTRIIELTE